MTGRTHDLAAITALGGVILLYTGAPTVTLGTLLLALLANQLGGIAPDIDQPTAPLWRNLPIGELFGKLVDKTLGGHRFLTHSLLGLALFGYLFHWLLAFLSPVLHGVDLRLVWWAFVIGMVSHLVMDSFTKEGVPWLLPIPMKLGFPPLKSMRVTTGHFMELWVIFPVLLALDIAVCAGHYHQILFFLHHRVV